MHRLILFDVDGTLLSTNGQAGEALGTALRETFGTAGPIEHYPWAGKTDPQIVFELLGHAGIPRADVQPRLSEVFDVYCDNLARRLTPANTSALAGVHELLQALGRRSDIAVGLLTGNIRRGADIKLTAAGLGGYFTMGAFGSDQEDRNLLVAVARERAKALWGDEFSGTRTTVVGDAEPDIRCARAGGARSISVASGKTPRETLATLHPDVLLESLASPLALPALIGPNG